MSRFIHSLSSSLRARISALCAVLLFTSALVFSQAALSPAAPAPPPSPVSGVRNKMAAGDLLSAESVLEVHRAKY